MRGRLAAGLLFLLLAGCLWEQDPVQPQATRCDGLPYPDPASSPYVLPFAVGMTVETGLTNCSSSFHAAGQPDQYATDFDVPASTPFVAARAGTVEVVVEDQASAGGGNGNYLLIAHGDGTYAYYLHAPHDGIAVAAGDSVKQGDVLGVVGQSGLAGYPHLHFIVVEGDPAYPYTSIPVSFRNAHPRHTALWTNSEYEVRPY